MIKLYDKTGSNLIGSLDNCLECTVEEERNGNFELIMIYPIVDSLYNSLEKENIIIADANDTLKSQKFRIYNTRKLMSNRVGVYARHISFDLMYDFVEDITFENQSCEYALNQIFRNSNFSTHYRGYSDIVNAQNYKINKVNCLSAIAGTTGSIIDTFGTGAEILRDNTNIYVNNRRGHDNSVSIEYRKNLTGLEVEEDTTDLVTRIFPYATQRNEDNTETIITLTEKFIDAPNINSFSHPYITCIDYSDKFENEEEITQAKLRTLCNKEYTVNKVHIPKMNYKIEFIPLSKTVGYENLNDKISLCDTVTIRDTRYNIDTQAKVIKTVYNVLLERYDSMELGEPRTTLGDVITGAGGSNDNGDSGGSSGDTTIDDTNFPDVLPPKPVLSSRVMGFGSIEVSWTFENKTYFSYELYASKIKDFTPNSFYLIYEGQASAFLHVVEADETWYYRVCGKNSHGSRGEFSEQLIVNTTKLDDFEQYFNSLAVKKLVTNMFSTDYMEAGIIKGHWLDVRNLSVTDGNGKRTVDIDSFGNVALDVTSLKISSSSVATNDSVKNDIDNAINSYKTTVNKELNDIKDAMDNLGDTLDEAFRDGIISEAEAIAIKQQIQSLEIEKKDIDSVYNTLYANSDLIGTAKSNLYNAKNSYNTAHTTLINAINNAIADKKITVSENTTVKNAFTNYGTALATFSTRSEEALNSIAEKKKQDAIGYTDTQFSILDGKITSKITSADAQSIATQTVNGFKNEVANTYITNANASKAFDELDENLKKNYLTNSGAQLVYATKSEVTQSANSIKTMVADTYITNDSAAQSFANLDTNIANKYVNKTSFTQTVDSINTTVAKKVGTGEIISKINQTAESIKIKANKLELDGNTLLKGALKLSKSSDSSKFAELQAVENNAGVNMLVTLGGSTDACSFEVCNSNYTRRYFWTNYQGTCVQDNLWLYSNNTSGYDKTSCRWSYGSFYPTTNNKGYLGLSNAYWNTSFISNMNSSDLNNTNSAIIGKNLTVGGNTASGTFTGKSFYSTGWIEAVGEVKGQTFTCKGNQTIAGTLAVSGTTSLNGYTVVKNNSFGVEKNVDCNGTLTVGGTTTLKGYTVIKNNSLGVESNIYCNGVVEANRLAISGSKNCIQDTESFGKRLVNAYETADYYFGDIGESAIENGECVVYLDDIFKEVITSDITYQVFLTKYGKGDIWVSERHEDYFVVQADNDISFCWEIKAKRRGFENNRLEEYIEEVIEDAQEDNTI